MASYRDMSQRLDRFSRRTEYIDPLYISFRGRESEHYEDFGGLYFKKQELWVVQ